MAANAPQGTLIVFAREPIAGRVKRRLIPALGVDGAARLYRTLLDIALDAANAVPGVKRELWYAGSPLEGGVCAELASRNGMALRRQPAGNLGVRMAAAMSEALTHSGRVVLIGSDCPDYSPEFLTAAFAALDKVEAVLGPAADGGYVLIGLRRMAPELFTDIPWGGGRVLGCTRTALWGLGWTWTELPTLRDLDRPGDLGPFGKLLQDGRPKN
jgi:rSAM/selenodomain-associated transferase 1